MKKRLLNVLFLLCVISGLAMWLLYTDMQAQLHQPLKFSEPERLVVEPGMSLKTISSLLVDRGWLSHPHYLVFEGRRQGSANSIKAGEYALSPGTSPAALLQILVDGKVIQYSLTLVEGWSFRQIALAVAGSPYLRHTLADMRAETVMRAIGQAGRSPEGMFFPDTYHFPRSTTDVEFLLRAYRTMQVVLEQEWQKRVSELPYKTAYDALIMASIIEKETAVPEEYGKIAGVFVRRLGLNMKLQTDPTVIYALGQNFDGNIRRKDLYFDSPYNTYVYRGLPPTPIAVPGRGAIHAALNPEKGQALYFVARGDGSHYFSSTLEEHNNAVRKYQLKK